MHMLRNEDDSYPGLVSILCTDYTDGPEVLVRCVYDGTSLS